MVSKSNMSAIQLTINFFKGNYALNFAVLAVLVALAIFGFIPLLGIVFAVAYSILSFSIQIYFGRVVNKVENVNEISNEAADTRVKEFLIKYLPQASGGFLGLTIVAVLMFFIFMILISIFGNLNIIMQYMQGVSHNINNQLIMFSMVYTNLIPSAIMLLIIGFLFYIIPAVFGEIIFSENFNKAFKKSFLLLNPLFWKKTFNKNYFILIVIWSIIASVVYIFSVFLSSMLILLPVALLILYLLNLYNAAVYVFAKELESK